MFKIYPNSTCSISFFFTQFAGVQAISSAILDVRPDLRPHEARVVLGVCACGWLLALPMIFDGGIYLFTLMDWNTASWAILLIGFAELALPAWCYGCGELLSNVDQMNMKFGPTLRVYWRISWTVLAPATALASIILCIDIMDSGVALLYDGTSYTVLAWSAYWTEKDRSNRCKTSFLDSYQVYLMFIL